MSFSNKYDIAVVGGGILGTAHAYEAAKRGLKVAIFERNLSPVGATVRNFGMVWPIGQPKNTFERAMRARAVWLELAEKAGFWAKPWGSLHVAYHKDEWEVLQEFVATTAHIGYQTQLLTPEQSILKNKIVNPIGLRGALFSATEVNVDPREAIVKLHQYLINHLGVKIYYHTAISAIQHPTLSNGKQEWQADQILVCSGADFETLYPEIFAQQPITKCKLQMMRTVPQPNQFQLGPNLAGGLTLQHYHSFAHCKSLVKLKQRFTRDMEEYNRCGIHVLLSQTQLGELTIGDSHEYGLNPSPFDKQHINQLILNYLNRFALIPAPAIAEMWHGVYPKMQNGQTELVVSPEEGVTVINGIGGAGMTLSFGLAQEVLQKLNIDKQVILV
jgi:FAD dependent oxidoreductase TIGR03364